MRRTLASLILLLTFLLCFAGTASGAHVDMGSENRVGVLGPNPDIDTYTLGSLELEPQRGNTILGYDPATGVVFYVRQNPWSKFDPKGLWEKEVATQIVRTVAQTTARMNLVSSVVSTGLVVAHIGVKMHEASQAPPGSFNQTKTCVNGISQGDSGSVDHFTMAQQISDPGKISVHTEEGSYESKVDGGWTQTSGQNIGTRGNPDSGGDSSPTESAKEVSISGRGPGFPEQTVLGPPNAKVRTSNRPGAEKAVELTYPDGVVKDISPSRVKGRVPNTHPKAPPGATTPIHFDNPINVPKVQPHKRVPTQDELDTLDNATN